MVAARAPYEYVDGGAGRSIVVKVRPLTEHVSVPLRVTLCLLHNGRGQCNQTPTRWLAGSLRTRAIFWAGRYLLLAD